MTENQKNLAVREDAYRLLAACYYPPTPALLEEDCCEALATALFSLSPEAASYAKEAARIADGQTVEALAIEHARLFLGPFQLVAPPYGSFYIDDNKAVMGDSTAAALAFYEGCGLHLADDFPELPDHVSVELEFMSFLAFSRRQADGGADGENSRRFASLQREFLEKFLLPWMPSFTRAVIDDGEAPFYQAIARCTACFVASDFAALKVAAGA